MYYELWSQDMQEVYPFLIMNINQLKEWLGKIKYKDWSFHIRECEDTPACRILLHWMAFDALHPNYKEAPLIPLVFSSTFDYRFMQSLNEESFYKIIHNMVLEAEYHELNEFFKYNETQPFWPHKEIK
jgi:hypothetical protein